MATGLTIKMERCLVIDIKKRLISERDDIDIKIKRISVFLEMGKKIDPKQVDLMREQLKAMSNYSEILSKRIEVLK